MRLLGDKCVTKSIIRLGLWTQRSKKGGLEPRPWYSKWWANCIIVNSALGSMLKKKPQLENSSYELSLAWWVVATLLLPQFKSWPLPLGQPGQFRPPSNMADKVHGVCYPNNTPVGGLPPYKFDPGWLPPSIWREKMMKFHLLLRICGVARKRR